MIELLLIKTQAGLIPYEPQDAYEFEKLPFGKPIRSKNTVARSNPQNRWFHSCLNILFTQQDTWPTPKLFKDKVKEALGLCDYYEVHGRTYCEVHSVAFDKISQEDMNAFIDRFVKLVCERIIPNMGEDDACRMLGVLDANSGKQGSRIIPKTKEQAA